MHRIDTQGNVNNGFTDGNPQSGQEATIIDDDWLNAVQNEIINVILAANIDLVKGENTQLREAIIALIGGVVGSGDGSVPTTRRVNTVGLLSGGGALAADLNISLNAASAAEIADGTRNDVAVTPLGIASAFSSASNVQSLPGGGLIQYGQLNGNFNEGSALVTLPTSFQSNNYAVVMSAINISGNVRNNIWMQRVSKGVSNFTGFFNYGGDGTDFINGFEYIAIGR